MKKIYLLPAVSLMTLISCTKDNEDPVVPDDLAVPEIVVETAQVTVGAEEATHSIAYEIINPSDTASLSVSCESDWITYVSHTDSEITFSVTAWDSLEETRTAVMTLSYTGAEDVQVTVVQLQPELPECPVEMYILAVSYYYATITWLPENDEIQYISFVMEKSEYDKFSDDAELFADDLAYMQSNASSLGMSLEEYLNGSGLLYSEGMTNQVTGRTPGTEYVVYSYSVMLQDGALIRTSAISAEPFTTKELVMHEADFVVDADMRSNRMTLKVSSGTEDFRFGMTLFSEDDYSAFANDEAAAEELIWSLSMLVNINGLTWSDVTYLSEGEAEYDNLVAGDKYYAVVCGVDDGVRISNIATEEFTVPMPEITDGCTFTADFIRMVPTEVDVTVTPSNGETRYLAVIEDASEFTSGSSYETYVAELIYRLNYYDAVDWESTSLLHTGTHTFNSHTDVVNPEYLKADTDYVLLVFGVDTNGERTTEIFHADFTTPLTEQTEMTIDIEITSVEAKAISAVFTPSDTEANYHYDAYPIEDYEGFTPEEFMDYVISINGEWLSLYQGVQEHTFTYYFPRQEYVVFAFGYDGTVTTDLFLKHVDMVTGEVTEMGVIPKEQAIKYFNGRF